MDALVERFWRTQTRDAAQAVPALDLWVGRHEKLYSRIFNS
jgi:urease accessory protein